MNVSRPIRFALLLAAAMPLAAAGRAAAQYVPYARYGSSGWGPYASPSAAYVDRGVMEAQKGADRRQQLDQTFQQQQSRNNFLLDQSRQNSAWIAQNRQSVEQFRMQQLQTQSQQAAAYTARAPAAVAAQPLPLLPGPPVSNPPAASPPATVHPELSGGDFYWGSILGDPRFEAPRSELEKLLGGRKWPQAGRTSSEYDAMIDLVGKMKGVLRQIADELKGSEYVGVEEFLDDLIAHVRAAANPKK
jgi:hypothetical protein